MTQYGKQKSIYLQIPMDVAIEKALVLHPEAYPTRTRFINVAIIKLLRELKIDLIPLKTRENQAETRDFMG